ncbi:MAG: polymer-forming cytoskeletal protein [Chloroflexota bacterium]|nr:polymer-forming cytoskeletal protein [Chloroflexota bacterium]
MMSIRSAGATDYLPVEADGELTDDTYSVIDRHSSFDGTFRSDRDLRIDGEVKGTIECQGTLFVAEGATVSAKVNAENVTVAGDLSGEIICGGRLQMLPSGRVRGKIATQTLVVAEGAYYEGELEMARPEERESRTRRISGSPSTAPVPINGQAGEPARSGGGPTTFIRRLGSPETAWDTKPDESAPSEPAAAAHQEEES